HKLLRIQISATMVSIQDDEIGHPCFHRSPGTSVDISRHELPRLCGDLLSDVRLPPPGLLPAKDAGCAIEVPMHKNLQAPVLLGSQNRGYRQSCCCAAATTQKRSAGNLAHRNGTWSHNRSP